MSISKSTRISDIWNLFYNRLSTDVTTVTLINSSVITIQRYSAAFSNQTFDTKSNFPIMIIESPTFSDSPRTLSKEISDGSIVVEIYTTQAESADKFTDAIMNSIETYKKTLADNGLKQVHGEVTLVDSAENGKIQLHLRRMRFSFEYTYTKTQSF